MVRFLQIHGMHQRNYKMYKQIKNMFGEIICVVKTDDVKYIPFDPANMDYQDYLKWLAEGNEPLPADQSGE